MRWRVWIISAAMLVILPASTMAAGPRIGEVKSAEGAVTIERTGDVIEAAPGTDLFQSDIVRTGPAGSVGMTFTDNSRMSLGPSSELALEKYLFTSSRKAFDARLVQGSMTAASGQIAKEPMAMRVLIPTGILGVRGTEFAVQANP